MSSALAPNVLPTGTSLQQGKYRIEKVLRQSDSLITYLATHRGLDQAVAIQTLRNRPELHPNQPRIAQRFIAAAQKIADISHPSLVHVNDLFVELEFPYMVMDYLLGDSLGKLANQQPLSEKKALNYIFQVAPALIALHQHHCPHGSLQPDYLHLQRRENRIMLVDLGVESSLMPGSLNSGSIGYISPEQYSPNQGLSPASDVYSLAAILYTLLTGHCPVAATLRPQNTLPSPRQFCAHLSLVNEQAILAGMALKVSERPPSIEQWLALLSLEPQPVSSSINVPTTQLQTATQLQVGAVPVETSSPPREKDPKAKTGPETERVVASPPAPSSTLTKTMPVRSKTLAPSTFPIRFLLFAGGIAGLMGVCFGFILRFNYFTQFSPSQAVSSQGPKVQKESFPVRPKAELSDSSPSDDAVERFEPEPNREREDALTFEPPAQSELATEVESRQTLQSSQTSPPDSIVESEIDEVPRELTSAGLTAPQDDSAAISDWADVVPSQSAYQVASPTDDEIDVPAENAPLPDELDLPSDPEREFLSPQI